MSRWVLKMMLFETQGLSAGLSQQNAVSPTVQVYYRVAGGTIRAKMGRWVCMTHDNIGNRGLTHNSCKCESDRESILLEVCVTNACSIMMLMLEFVKSIYRQSEEEVQRYNNQKVKVSLSKKLNLSCIQWACLVCHHQCQ